MIDLTEMQEIILTVGIPASGKDTWAREKALMHPNKYVIVNRDDIRKGLFTESGSIHDYVYSKEREHTVTREQVHLAKQALSVGKSLIVSDTNLNPATYDTWRGFAVEHAILLAVHTQETPLYECIKRNSKRPDHVPESVMIRMETKMRKYLGKYIYDSSNPTGLPECVIIDIDGTLADMKGIRKPYEWDKVHLDKPRGFVCDYARSLHAEGKTVFIFSGRDSVCRKGTEEWLEDNLIPYNYLYMRDEGSSINDTVVKEDMFDKYVKDKYHVSHVIDDRKSVVQMWKSIGFDVIDVGSYLNDF